ncbi:unnamed protein product [Lupinus luteus]|uniref:Uncharacterized protein n=1 Tax=Lupinus luteus TaxID=3873 RepID=A0AAV1Y657_LUPLU
MFPDKTPNRWERMTHHVPGTWLPEDLKQRYEKLEHEVLMIVSGHYEFPELWKKVDVAALHQERPAVLDNRKKGLLWTDEEHRIYFFYMIDCFSGLKHVSKGDWKGIVTQFVVSRTPSQVASHAQKYFLRQNTSETSKKRKSIHDITTKESDQNSLSLPHFNKKHNSVPCLDNDTLPAQNWLPPLHICEHRQHELQRASHQPHAEMLQNDSSNNSPKQMARY